MLNRFKVLIFILICSQFLHAESSLYGFGTDIADRSNDSDRDTISFLKQKIAKQDERIDGLTTIIEGLSASINELKTKNNLSLANGSSDDNALLLQKLAKMIDEIDANYVSKSELSTILNGKKNIVKKESVKGDKSISSIYSEGVRLFVKKHYSDAKKKFTLTDERAYKPAASNYYLGEIAYYTKEYKDAIFYYKKSAGLYDKASYIDVLLFHTAVSLEKTGNRSQAKVFYQNIIDNYPNKKSAKIAKQRIKKL